jgi:hypothetical protein
MRLLAATTLAALLGLSVAAEAADVQAIVKSVDKKKNTITVTVNGKDTTYTVSPDASFVTVSQVPGKKGMTTEKLTPIDGGLDGVKPGAKVTILTDTVDDKTTVTSLKVADGNAAPAAANPNKNKKKKKKT